MFNIGIFLLKYHINNNLCDTPHLKKLLLHHIKKYKEKIS